MVNFDASNESAYNRGLKDAEVESRLADHDRHLSGINGSIDRLTTEIRAMSTRVGSVQESLSINEAVAKALADSLKQNTEKQVTTRTFIIGIVALIISLAALILGVNA